MKKSIYTSGQEALQALLRQTRQKAGLTQRQMAKKLGTLQAIVSNYETGERRLDVLELRQVCEALGVSLPDFMDALEAVLAGAAPEDVVEWDMARRNKRQVAGTEYVSADPQADWGRFVTVMGPTASMQDSESSVSNQGGTKAMRNPEQEPLIEERRFFAESLPVWMQEHEGEFDLVNGREMIGFFGTFGEASAEGARRFGTANHLIRKVGPRERFAISAREVVYIGGDLAGRIPITDRT